MKVIMKTRCSILVLLFVLVFSGSFALAGCSLEPGSAGPTGAGGVLTITDIPSRYNGWYMVVDEGWFIGSTQPPPRYRLNDRNWRGSGVYVRGNRISIPLWVFDDRELRWSRFNFSGDANVLVIFFPTQNAISGMRYYDFEVFFLNGNATVRFSEHTIESPRISVWRHNVPNHGMIEIIFSNRALQVTGAAPQHSDFYQIRLRAVPLQEDEPGTLLCHGRIEIEHPNIIFVPDAACERELFAGHFTNGVLRVPGFGMPDGSRINITATATTHGIPPAP